MPAARSRAKSSAKVATSTSPAVKVPHLPTPEAIDHLPWPYFAVSAAERRRVVARRQPQTVTLGALSATVPLIAPHTAPAMTVPQSARRATAALHPPAAVNAVPPATRALLGTQRPASQPARPPRQAAPVPVPVTAPVAIAAAGAIAGGPAMQAMAPRRVAGPLMPPIAAGSAVPPSSSSSAAGASGAAATSPAARGRPVATLRLPPAPDAARLTSWAISLGLLGILCGFVTGVPAAICGYVALRRLARARDAGTLRRRAQWAIALGYATSLFWAAYLLLTMVR